MQKENQRVAISKRLLKDGIMRLLKKKHIDKISVAELCAESQINRTTFYRHYQTPHDVLLELELDLVKNLFDISGSAENTKDISIYVLRTCTFLQDNKDLTKLFIANNMDKDFMRFFHSLADTFLGSRAILYKGRLADEETMRLLTTSFASSGYSLLRQWIMEGIKKSPEEIAELILGSFNRDITFV